MIFVEKICKQCEKKYLVENKKNRIEKSKFCSRKCYWESMPKIYIGKNASSWRGGRIKRSGYWYIFKPEHPNAGKQGYIAEHRLAMEKHLGRALDKKECVHHKNGIITDNRIENLELFSSHGQHTKLAHPEVSLKGALSSVGRIPWNKGIKKIFIYKCSFCGKRFEVDYSQFRKKTCSIKCLRKLQSQLKIKHGKYAKIL